MPSDPAGPRALAAPLFTPRRVPAAFGGLLARTRLRAGLEKADLQPAPLDVCVQVRAASSGEVLYELNGDRPEIPASTMKLLTTAAALSVLGPDFRFSTEARASAAVSGGVLQGPLYIVGAGDGLLSTPSYAGWEETRRPEHIPLPPRTDLTGMARAIKGAGITRVAGPILGDDSLFDDQRIHPGWKQSYFDEKIIAPITALAVNRNLVNWGGSLDAVGFAPDPPAQAADSLRQLLVDQGVAVDGAAGAGKAPRDARVVASLPSVPLSQIVRHVLQASDNYLAENLIKTLGQKVKGQGSFGAGAEVVAETLAKNGVAVKGLVMNDGSGLARTSRVPCALLTDLLARTPELEPLLSVSGEIGTLRQRFPDPDLRGKVKGKTGSLENVSNLSGLVSTADDNGELAFAVLVTGDDGVIAVEIQRRVVMQLLRFPEAVVEPAGG